MQNELIIDSQTDLLNAPIKMERKPASEVQAYNETASVMAAIERAVLNPAVDVDKMQRLLDMQERILDRNARQAFASAMALMQADLSAVVQDGAIDVKGDIRSRYAKFETINEMARPVLERHGFAISFRIKQDGGNIEVKAVLSHREGHSEETSMVLPADNTGSKNSVQAVGSSVSYGKRYTMCALLNITTKGEDDDAAALNKLVSPVQVGIIKEKLMQAPPEAREEFRQHYAKISDVAAKDFDQTIARLNAEIEKAKGEAA